MHQALYRKWRPMRFEDVVGQEHVTRTLRAQSVASRLSHAYLFCGPRGTGKTTCARILAKAANCLSPVDGDPCNCCAACNAINDGSATDVFEMDAATYTGVDDIRALRGEAVYAPSSLKMKVYIIDEVHMLSIGAFNALLKTLEEPPSHAVFILAT
ncbi:MAG: DNA polymerase III subunit gamma/tau, partial [Clostridia bacterium]|nr:DNA polymerase III subunit gamma/tau [Clostridia bacterium]